MTGREIVAQRANMEAVFDGVIHKLTIFHKERKKEAKKERKDYCYYTLNLRKSGLDKGSISILTIRQAIHLSIRKCLNKSGRPQNQYITSPSIIFTLFRDKITGSIRYIRLSYAFSL
jgi:hypothetical protein